MEMKEPGDRGLYRNRLTLTKQGDRLTFSNSAPPSKPARCRGFASCREGWSQCSRR